MKHWPKWAAVMLILALLLGAFAVAYAQEIKPPAIPFLAEWQASPHADVESASFTYWDNTEAKAIPVACAKCHSTTGFLDFLGVDDSEAGKVDKAAAIGTTVECVACHNAATAGKTSVLFPSGVELTDLGGEAVCMECHQGRQSKTSVDRLIFETFKLTEKDLDTVVKPMVAVVDSKTVTTTFGFLNIHYYAAAATLYGTLTKGGYEYAGMSYDGKFEHPAPFDTCTGCHNSHTLELDIEACATCHEGVATVEDLADIRMYGSRKDYDGDGNDKSGIGVELAGLKEKLMAAITAYAKEVAKADIVYNKDAHPYWFGDANANGKFDEGEKAYTSWTPRLLMAAYNYQVASKDPGGFAHNAKYVIQLTYDSIMDLNTKLAKPVDMSKAVRNDAGHFDGTSAAFRYWDNSGVVPAQCAKCHAAAGLPQFLANNGTVAVAGANVLTVGVTGAKPSNGLACDTCHNDLAEYTVYPVVNVPFPSGRNITFSTEKDDKGNLVPVADNLCLECHQGRQSTAALNNRIGKNEDDKVPERKLSFANVHYFAAGASLFGTEAQGAYEYADKEYVGRFAHVPGLDTCTGCHSTHRLGISLDKCTSCHAGIKSLDEIRFGQTDYDGDKDVKEGIKAEILALEEKLWEAMQAYAKKVSEAAIVYDSHAHPYFFADANDNGQKDADEKAYTEWTPRLLRAAYNYQYVQKDPGIYAHNPKYAFQILFDSLESLNGAGGLKVDMTGLVRPEVKK